VKEADIRPADLFNRYLELSRADVERFFPDHSNFVIVQCPACGDGRSSPGLVKLGFTYVSCLACGSLYANPRPSAAALDDFYRNAESVRFWSTNFFKETAEARRERMFRPRAELVSRLTREHGRGNSLFVDVGAGYGILLEEVRRQAIFDEVIGIEPSPHLAADCRARGFRVVEKPIESVSAEECQASFATTFEVLEHVFSPRDFLAAIAAVLEPGGLALWTTLTVSGFDIQVLWENSKSVYPPHHLNLISVRGMRELIARSGFNCIDISTPGRLDVDIVCNAAKEQPALELPRFVSYLIGEAGDETRIEFQRFLSSNLLSSHIQVVAAKSASNSQS
jgi:SAM-dependent methyltransferase